MTLGIIIGAIGGVIATVALVAWAVFTKPKGVK